MEKARESSFFDFFSRIFPFKIKTKYQTTLLFLTKIFDNFYLDFCFFFEIFVGALFDAIQQIAMSKAPDNDSMPPEIFKYGGQKLTVKLHYLFISIWITGKVS